MKHICDDVDHKTMKRGSEQEGFRRAEKLLEAILNGERNIRFALEEPPLDMRPQNTCSIREWNPSSPWVKLVDRLDLKLALPQEESVKK